jgi:hypothetical protein
MPCRKYLASEHRFHAIAMSYTLIRISATQMHIVKCRVGVVRYGYICASGKSNAVIVQISYIKDEQKIWMRRVKVRQNAVLVGDRAGARPLIRPITDTSLS